MSRQDFFCYSSISIATEFYFVAIDFSYLSMSLAELFVAIDLTWLISFLFQFLS